MKQIIVFLAGLLFSSGLMVSGMVNPAKVLGFLDLFGSWDPSLAFVLLGAVIVTFFGYRIVLQRPRPIFQTRFFVPARSDIDLNLVAGSALFGIGWGLVGLCPGPAIAAFAVSPAKIVVFLSAMIIGMYIPRMMTARPQRRLQPE